MARIASGNYDTVIVSHRSLEFLPVSDRLFNRFIDRRLDQPQCHYEARAETGDNRRIVKELEKSKKRVATKLKQRADRERKDLLRGTRRIPDFVDSGSLQEPVLCHPNESHRRPAELG